MTDLFQALAEDHPSVDRPCAMCQAPFRPGDRFALVPSEPVPNDGRFHTVEADMVCEPCVTKVRIEVEGRQR